MAALPPDCRRCLRSTFRSCNDVARLLANAMGRGLPFVVRYSAAMNMAGCYVPFTISVRR
jgi:hypothetical protein